MKLKNSNCDIFLNLKLGQKSKTQSDKTQKLNLLRKKLKKSKCDKTQIVTKLKNSNYDKNSKTQIVTKLKNSNCDESQIVMK